MGDLAGDALTGAGGARQRGAVNIDSLIVRFGAQAALEGFYLSIGAGELSAFLLEGDAQAWAQAKGDDALDFAPAKASLP